MECPVGARMFTILLLSALLFALCLYTGEAANEKPYYSNPIVKGDWSDPALIRVGNDFYSLRSTFGWQPGLTIIHSKDLINWEYIGYAYITHPAILPGDTTHGCWGAEMGYNPNNSTFVVYAPIAKRIYAFASRTPGGPYGNAVDLGINAIDPGFFADDDGRLYLVHSEGQIAELSSDGLSVKREVCNVGVGRSMAFEGPDIFKHGGYYYCLYSTGGTRPHQTSTICTVRAKSIDGPWEQDPNNPVMQANDDTGAVFQGPAHGTLVEVSKDEWYVTYHAFELSHYSLGRQMCMEPIEWTSGGWWRPVNGRIPSTKSKKPSLQEARYELASSDEFDKAKLGHQWFFHTKPDFSGESWSLTDRPGYLRIKTHQGDISSPESLPNVFLQRVDAKKFELSARVEFDAKSGSEAAGIHLWHDPGMNFWLASAIKDGNKIFEVGKYDNGVKSIIWSVPNIIGNTVYLKIAVDGEERTVFYFSADNKLWTRIGSSVYFGTSVDDLRDGIAGSPDLGWIGIKKRNTWTAATMGVFAVQNGANAANHADFDWFRVTKF